MSSPHSSSPSPSPSPLPRSSSPSTIDLDLDLASRSPTPSSSDEPSPAVSPKPSDNETKYDEDPVITPTGEDEFMSQETVVPDSQPDDPAVAAQDSDISNTEQHALDENNSDVSDDCDTNKVLSSVREPFCCNHTKNVTCMSGTCTCLQNTNGSSYCTNCKSKCCRNTPNSSGEVIKFVKDIMNKEMLLLRKEIIEIKAENEKLRQSLAQTIEETNEHWKLELQTNDTYIKAQKKEIKELQSVSADLKQQVRKQQETITIQEKLIKQNEKQTAELIAAAKETNNEIKNLKTQQKSQQEHDKHQEQKQQQQEEKQPQEQTQPQTQWSRPVFALLNRNGTTTPVNQISQSKSQQPQQQITPKRQDEGCSIIIRGIKSSKNEIASNTSGIKQLLVERIQAITIEEFAKSTLTWINYSTDNNHYTSIAKLLLPTAQLARQVLRHKRSHLDHLNSTGVYISECLTPEAQRARKAAADQRRQQQQQTQTQPSAPFPPISYHPHHPTYYTSTSIPSPYYLSNPFHPLLDPGYNYPTRRHPGQQQRREMGRK